MTDLPTTQGSGKPPASTGTGAEVHRAEGVDPVTRVFRLGGEWYFATRDGDIGPFRTREQARREARVYTSVREGR